jgi:hypothetical protein
MSIADIKGTDIQEASWMDDVGKAVRYLQDIAEIGPSNESRQYLDETKWRDTDGRIKLIQKWLAAEALDYERI